MERLHLTIEGMSCEHCVRAVRGRLERTDGVKVDDVTIGSAVIDFDPYWSEMDRIIDAWLPLTFAVNSINRSMGQPDLYPFMPTPPVIWKLTFIHNQIHAVSSLRPPDSGGDALRAIIAGLKRSVASPQPTS